MKNKLTLGSLFDGSGGFPLGGLMCEIQPVWASEVEPFPIRVTTKRLPFVKHYGDINKIDGSSIEPVDIITFGSPCTDLSVAGKRAGLGGRNSSLFHQAIRIVKEMRRHTNDKYPRFIVFENVPGVFSSSKGQDFRTVLEEICKIKDETISVPMPEKSKWLYAGNIVGNNFSLCWRVLDAKYFGVPQRRRRVYLVADFGSERASEILFESQSVPGNTSKNMESRERAPENAQGSSSKSSVPVINDQGGKCISVSHGVISTLRAEEHGHQPLVFEPGAITRLGGHMWQDLSGTLRADMGDNQPAVVIENHSSDSRVKISKNDIFQTLTNRMGTGGNNVPMVMQNQQPYEICSDKSNSMLSKNPKSGFYESNTSKTIDTSGNNPSCNQGGTAVVESYSLQGNMIGRKEANGPRGNGVNENISFTLNATDHHGVVYSLDRASFNQGPNAKFDISIKENQSQTLVSRGPNAVAQIEATSPKYMVRKLTPKECAKLQGFPSDWCSSLETENPTWEDIDFWSEVWESHRKILGKSQKSKSRNQIIKWLKFPHSDSAEYKMWGNGVALPCVCFVLSRIKHMKD